MKMSVILSRMRDNSVRRLIGEYDSPFFVCLLLSFRAAKEAV